jgi:hypothetical protein
VIVEVAVTNMDDVVVVGVVILAVKYTSTDEVAIDVETIGFNIVATTETVSRKVVKKSVVVGTVY